MGICFMYYALGLCMVTCSRTETKIMESMPEFAFFLFTVKHLIFSLLHKDILRYFSLICKWEDKILVSCCLLVPLCHLTHNYAKNAYIVAVSLLLKNDFKHGSQCYKCRTDIYSTAYHDGNRSLL